MFVPTSFCEASSLWSGGVMGQKKECTQPTGGPLLWSSYSHILQQRVIFLDPSSGIKHRVDNWMATYQCDMRKGHADWLVRLVSQSGLGSSVERKKKIHLLPGPTLAMSPPPRTVPGMPEGAVCSPPLWKRHHESFTSNSSRVIWQSAESIAWSPACLKMCCYQLGTSSRGHMWKTSVPLSVFMYDTCYIRKMEELEGTECNETTVMGSSVSAMTLCCRPLLTSVSGVSHC